MNRIKKFVSNLLKDYFSDNDKKELIDILTTSLEEKVKDLVEQGTTVEKAIERSIQEFGSADDVLEAFPKKDSEIRVRALKERKSQLHYSIGGYLLIVGIALFFNFTFLDFFGQFYWFIVVAIGTLFWPLSMLYRYLTSKK